MRQADPTILYGVGATKAGTSWLYRYLHDHPQARVPAVKEAHYWDTFDPVRRDKQIANYQARLEGFFDTRTEAIDAGRDWQVHNMDRRIASMSGLLAVLAGDRAGDGAYLRWLAADAKVVADMTPAYAMLSEPELQRMLDLSPKTKFVYLMRDPLDRMWSHIRMQAKRYRQTHEIYDKKANNILRRVVLKDKETHIMALGDYPATITKLRNVVPPDRLHIEFTENMFAGDGLVRLCDFVGVTKVAPHTDKPVHAGQDVVMMANLRSAAQDFLAEQYEWVAKDVGPLPQRWHDNQARTRA